MAEKTKVKDEAEAEIALAGMTVDSEGHVVDPAFAPYSGQTESLKRAEDDKLAEYEVSKLLNETREDDRDEAEAEAVKTEKAVEEAKEEEAKARKEEAERRDDEAEEAQKNQAESKVTPLTLEEVEGLAPPEPGDEPDMPVLTEPPPKDKEPEPEDKPKAATASTKAKSSA